MPARKKAASPKDSSANLCFEAKLWLEHQEKRLWGTRFGRVQRALKLRLWWKQPNQSNPSTRRLAIMNLALRGIEADFGPENADTFRHFTGLLRIKRQLLANPPFNGNAVGSATPVSASRQSENTPLSLDRSSIKQFISIQISTL